MLGAIIGDIAGSRFEFNNHRSKKYDLFTAECEFTDDTVMTIAVGLAIVNSGKDLKKLPALTVDYMRSFGRAYPLRGYGGNFLYWLESEKPEPYYSYGNGAVMRVSACGFMGKTLEEVKHLSDAVTGVTHNHPEGLKGAEATAVAIFLARKGYDKNTIKNYITEKYYPIDFTLDGIREMYQFDESCQMTVPQALEAFFESYDFEDAIRNATSIGGDSDTIAAITGAVAEGYYGIPEKLKTGALGFLDENLKTALKKCEDFIERINKNIL